VGLSDLGDGLTWGEAKILLDEAAADPGTALGAKLANWAYPASLRELLTLIAQIGNEKASRKVMPWAMPLAGSKATATAEEVAVAQAELEGSIVFAS
jgi:hypothetical protein